MRGWSKGNGENLKIAKCLVSISLAVGLAGCSGIPIDSLEQEKTLKVSVEPNKILVFSEPKYASAPINRGHVYYTLKPGKDFETTLDGASTLRFSVEDRNRNVAHSEWIKTEDFLSGQNEYFLNTGFRPEECNENNDGALLSLTIQSEIKNVATLKFAAPNKCTIDFFNLLVNGE